MKLRSAQPRCVPMRAAFAQLIDVDVLCKCEPMNASDFNYRLHELKDTPGLTRWHVS